MRYEIEIVEMPVQHAAVVTNEAVGAPQMAQFLGGAFGEVMQLIESQTDVDIAGAPFARYTVQDTGLFAVEAGFPVTGNIEHVGRVTMIELPGGPAAQTLHKGDYDAVADAYQAIERWKREYGYVAADLPWESYLDAAEVTQPRTVVCAPIRRAE
ncbi:MAG: GyrI-like domain-containing protein [Actinomycetia bacterium]|nr:GyrI-like domain-containing protein [Actinomycetes bacterium]